MQDTSISGPTILDPLSERQAKRVAFAAFIGTSMEWYDYVVYGTAIALVFNQKFFVTGDPVTSSVVAFGSFAIGFLARPIGAVIFGHLGDRLGRKKTLMITLILIGVATGGIGLLPTYFQIGMIAPIALTAIRLLQGISAGGEWGGAMTLTIEHAPAGRRAFYGALPQLGAPVAGLTSSLIFLVVSALPPEQFDSWGWRIPFLLAFPLLGIGVFIRMRIEESPVFEAMVEKEAAVRLPVAEVFRHNWRSLWVGILVSLLGISGSYMSVTFVLNYATTTLHMDKSIVLTATLLIAAYEILLILVIGRFFGHLGAKKITVVAGVVGIIVAFPMFWLVDSAQFLPLLLGMFLGITAGDIAYAALGTLLTEMFPADVRYSGVALAYNISGALCGMMPLAATASLTFSGGSTWAVSVLFGAVSALTLIAAVLTKRQQVPIASLSVDA